MKVVLLAGGLGTRISEESQFKPKPMIEIGGKPICKFRINGAPFSRQRCKRLAPSVRYPFSFCL